MANWYGGYTTVTNPANGKSVSEEWSGDFREHSIDRQPGGGYVYRYQSTDQGTYKIRDATGRIIYEEHGRVIASYLFDTVGEGSRAACTSTILSRCPTPGIPRSTSAPSSTGASADAGSQNGFGPRAGGERLRLHVLRQQGSFHGPDRLTSEMKRTIRRSATPT